MKPAAGVRSPLRLFARSTPQPADPDIAFLHWLAFAGVLLFAALLLWQHDVWATLIRVDPTYLTLVIILVFSTGTLWSGVRAWHLCREREQLDAWMDSARQSFSKPPAIADGRWIDAHFRMLRRRGPAAEETASQLADVLAERLHGAHESAWWFNGVQIKLGLLGKVIGFSILALQIAQIENFDPSQTQNLLKNLTGGLGIALLATAVGLVANILLGLQLVRLDRVADGLLADALQFAEVELPRFGADPEALPGRDG